MPVHRSDSVGGDDRGMTITVRRSDKVGVGHKYFLTAKGAKESARDAGDNVLVWWCGGVVVLNFV